MPLDPDNREQLERTVVTLNDLLAADRYATEQLFRHRVQVNDAFADSGLVVVSSEGVDPELMGSATCSLLGVLNGLLAPGRLRIASVHSDDDSLMGFSLLDWPPGVPTCSP
jgi:hypothetical protein